MERDAWSSDTLTLIPHVFCFWEIYMNSDVFFRKGVRGVQKKNQEFKHLKNPDPSKVANLRTYTPLPYRFIHSSIGGRILRARHIQHVFFHVLVPLHRRMKPFVGSQR